MTTGAVANPTQPRLGNASPRPPLSLKDAGARARAAAVVLISLVVMAALVALWLGSQ